RSDDRSAIRTTRRRSPQRRAKRTGAAPSSVHGPWSAMPRVAEPRRSWCLLLAPDVPTRAAATITSRRPPLTRSSKAFLPHEATRRRGHRAQGTSYAAAEGGAVLRRGATEKRATRHDPRPLLPRGSTLAATRDAPSR